MKVFIFMRRAAFHFAAKARFGRSFGAGARFGSRHGNPNAFAYGLPYVSCGNGALRILFRFLGCAILLVALGGCQLPFGRGGQQSVTQVKNPCIVLALPASGPYSPIAANIRKGAEAARAALKSQGIDVVLQQINTEDPAWISKLSALPETCVAVGGPLQDKKYSEASKAGITNNRVFFAFLPTLAAGEEGKKAWRFFPGQQDQIDALVNFATDKMNIRSYAAFYPTDNYGRRMADLLAASLAKRHMKLEKSAYNPQAPATWAISAKSLIRPKAGEDGKTTVPQTAFEAIFVPDSWKHMDGITAALAANGEDRLMLLGTNLWEQGLGNKTVRNPQRYSLAVFPVAWQRANPPAAMRKAGSDFWTALGFDFINFAGRLGLASRPDAFAVTGLAQKTSPSLKALAPLHWDNNGVLKQRMIIFQITPAGMAPVNEERFRQARTAAAERAALRMQGFGHIDPVTGEAIARPAAQTMPAEAETAASSPERENGGSEIAPASARESHVSAPQPAVVKDLPAPAGGATAEPGIMSSTPRPSYKLSLPANR